MNASTDRSKATGEFGERLGEDGLRFERHFDAPPERVWKALVTPEGLGAWLGEATRIEAHAGGAFEIRFNDEDRMTGSVLEWETNRRLVLAWREGSDESLVTFELAPGHAGGTSLVFTHVQVCPDDRIIGLFAGWHSHFDALEAVVAGRASPDRDALYEKLRPLYAARLAE